MAEKDYATICALATERTGDTPTEARVERIWCRIRGADVIAEVGKLDPMRGRLITAILDMGRAKPYLIHCGPPDDPSGQVLVQKPVYDVTRFEA